MGATCEEIVDQYEDRFGEEVCAGDVKAIMLGRCGGKENFEEALACGDIFEKVQDNGSKLYFHKSMRAVRRTGVRESTKVTTKAKLTDSQAKNLVDVMKSFDWYVEPTRKDKAIMEKGINDDTIMLGSTRTTIEQATVKLEASQKGARKLHGLMGDHTDHNNITNFSVF